MSAHHHAGGLLAALAGLSCLAAAGCAAGNAATAALHGHSGSHGSSGASGGTPAVASTVIPAQLGDTWVYAVDSSALGRGTETARISAVTPAAGGQHATLSTSLRLAGAKAALKFAADFTVGADGSVTFRSASFNGAKVASANANWPSPATLTPGQPRTSTVTEDFLGFKTTEHVAVTEVGPATVTVPAGTYQATLLEQAITDGPGSQSVIKAWVVNGIGQVKTETTIVVKGEREVSTAQELLSFTKG
ncbi:MAG TPA: hypothetical protein VGS19_27160 [Streptosporangiaceae bacterium]|nr:hypothetical protein [Streptosporangiaceae bacterium]